MEGKAADHFRQLAHECLAMANSGVTEKTRATLIALAEVCSRLADEQEKAFPPPSPVQAPRPVIQQQQQLQPKDDKESE